MKIAKFILPAVVLITFAIAASTGCKKKNQCYECSKNVGQPDEAHWNMCDDDEHERAVQAGYNCTKK